MSESTFETKQYKDLISKANSVPLYHILRAYGVRVGSGQSTVTCPFSFHSGGREKTGSFTFYPDTNSFFCYGCKTGGPWAHSCEFITIMEGISKVEAANKILASHKDKVIEDYADINIDVDCSEQLEIMLDLSDFVRETIQSNLNDKNCLKYMDNILKAFDKAIAKKKFENSSLKRFVEIVKTKVSDYKSCQQY